MDQQSVNIKELKTYARFPNNTKKVCVQDNQDERLDDLKVPLTTLNAVKYLLQGTLRLRVCRYCLNVTSELSEFDEVLTLAVSGNLHEVTLRDIVASFHPYKVPEDKNFPNKICSECVNRAIGCYLFTQQCERAERALRNCFDDINEKFDKLDPIEPVKKRGKRKLNPNHNIIYAEHETVIDYAEPVINIVNITEDSTVGKDQMSLLECQKCWQILPNVELLINHENSHPKSMWFNCRLCGKSFVKRPHLKRHLKAMHSYGDEKVKENDSYCFKCKECGEENTELGEHLQHMEKHKFKSSLKLLVERRDDSLCTVCLEKSSRLLNLSEVVQLHGGYSGFTGEKKMEDIVKTTIPGPNRYKYNELAVAHHPKIATLLKRKLESIANKRQNIYKTKRLEFPQELDEKFIFAQPILDKKTDFGIWNSAVVFTFSEPYLHGLSKIQVLEIDDLNIEGNELKKKHVSEEQKVDFDCASTFVPSNSDFLEPTQIVESANNRDVVDYGNNEIALSKKMCFEQELTTTVNSEITQDVIPIEGTNACKKDCIAKESNCESNVNSEVLKNEKLNEDVITKGDCKYCWIFSKTGRCDHCKKYIDRNIIICAANTPINEIKDLNEASSVTVLTQTYKTKKDIVKEQEIWQCNICLTNNHRNRLTCICCDGERMVKVNYKMSFLHGKHFFSEINNVTNSRFEKDVAKEHENQENAINVDKDFIDRVNTTENSKINVRSYKENITDQLGKHLQQKEHSEIHIENKNENQAVIISHQNMNKRATDFLEHKERSEIHIKNENNDVIIDHQNIKNNSKERSQGNITKDTEMEVDLGTIQYKESKIAQSAIDNNKTVGFIEQNALNISNSEAMDTSCDIPTNPTTVFTNNNTLIPSFDFSKIQQTSFGIITNPPPPFTNNNKVAPRVNVSKTQESSFAVPTNPITVFRTNNNLAPSIDYSKIQESNKHSALDTTQNVFQSNLTFSLGVTDSKNDTRRPWKRAVRRNATSYK